MLTYTFKIVQPGIVIIIQLLRPPSLCLYIIVQALMDFLVCIVQNFLQA